MKTLQIIILSAFIILAPSVFAQSVKKETFKVAGVCGMCKKKIETAAKSAGATQALWNVNSKELSVTYAVASSGTDKIQQSIAAEGYDTPKFKATQQAYAKLHGCCKYERVAEKAVAKANCCSDAGCTKDDCCAGADCCKEGSACCSDGKCSAKGDCCKQGSAHECCQKA